MNTEWRELKTLQDVAEAQKNGDEIEVSDDYVSWKSWFEKSWHFSARYRARPRQPKMKQVKMLCWFAGNELHWYGEDVALCGCARVPSEDKTIEIPE